MTKGTEKLTLRTRGEVLAYLERVANGLRDGSIKLQEARVHNRLASQALRALSRQSEPADRVQQPKLAGEPHEPDLDLEHEPTFEERVLAARAAERKRGNGS